MFTSYYHYTIDALKWSISIENNPHFFNIWFKEVSVNISYSRTVNQIDGHLDEIISPAYVRYIVSIYMEINNEKKKINGIQVGDILRLLKKTRRKTANCLCE